MDSKRVKVDTQPAAALKGECPVCFQIPRANIYQCANGHSLCDVCSNKVKACPTCRSPGVKIRNHFAESLLDDVQFKCNWSGRGCDKTMLRGQLTAHEDQCDKNPHLIKFCSLFPYSGKKCEYKFTSTWLSEPQNCTEFINHMKACRNSFYLNNFQIGHTYKSIIDWNDLKKLNICSSIPAHHYHIPSFYRFVHPGNSKEQIFFRMNLLKVDNAGNTSMSWVLVQLTPEITPIVARFTIDGNANSKMVSQWGQQSSPTLSWTLKPIWFNEFKKMVEVSQQTEKGLLFPFSVTLKFLSEYYVNDDGKISEFLSFHLRE